MRKKTCTLDKLAIAQLVRQNCIPETVPERGRIVHLRPYEGEVWGGYDEYLTEKVNPANCELARRAARLFGLEVAGIDIITEDITQPWYDTGAVINEVNYKPQIGENTARSFMQLSFPNGATDVRIECFVGDEGAMEAGRMRRAELERQLSGAFLTSHNESLDAQGEIVHLSRLGGLFARTELFLQDDRLTSLIVVIQTSEFLTTGLPFPRVDKILRVNGNLQDFVDDSTSLDSENTQKLFDLLNMYKVDDPEV